MNDDGNDDYYDVDTCFQCSLRWRDRDWLVGQGGGRHAGLNAPGRGKEGYAMRGSASPVGASCHVITPTTTIVMTVSNLITGPVLYKFHVGVECLSRFLSLVRGLTTGRWRGIMTGRGRKVRIGRGE